MDNDFSAKLKTVLSDPEAMAKISAIAQNLGASSNSVEPKPQERPIQKPEQAQGLDIMSALSGIGATVGDPRIELLNSLKPLLREEKRERVDALVRALSVAAMMKNFRK